MAEPNQKGTILRAIGPCGKGFSIGPEPTAVIVAGGIGIAPLAALAEWLRFRGKEVLVYIGAVEKNMLSLAATRNTGPEDDGREILGSVEQEFREIGARILTVCTDDGSIGERGCRHRDARAGYPRRMRAARGRAGVCLRTGGDAAGGFGNRRAKRAALRGFT